MKPCVCLLSVVVAVAWSVVGRAAEASSSFSEMQSKFRDKERALREEYLKDLCSLTNGSGKKLPRKEWTALTNEIAQVKGLLETAGAGKDDDVGLARKKTDVVTNNMEFSSLCVANGGRHLEIVMKMKGNGNKYPQSDDMQAQVRYLIEGSEKKATLVYDSGKTPLVPDEKSWKQSDFEKSLNGVRYTIGKVESVGDAKGKSGKNKRFERPEILKARVTVYRGENAVWDGVCEKMSGSSVPKSSVTSDAPAWWEIKKRDENAPLNINTAAVEELKGVKETEAYAEKIVAGRPYYKIDDIKDRKMGISVGKFPGIKDKICVR